MVKGVESLTEGQVEGFEDSWKQHAPSTFFKAGSIISSKSIHLAQLIESQIRNKTAIFRQWVWTILTITMLMLDIFSFENSVDPDQLASEKPAVQDPQFLTLVNTWHLQQLVEVRLLWAVIEGSWVWTLVWPHSSEVNLSRSTVFSKKG